MPTQTVPRFPLEHPAFPSFEPVVQNILKAFSRGDYHIYGSSRTKREAFADEEFLKEYLDECHAGFKEGQRLIVEAHLTVHGVLAKIKRSKASAGNKRRRALGKMQAVLKNRQAALRELADAVAWAVVGGAKWMTRRFATNPVPTAIQPDEIASSFEVVSDLNENVATLALLTDITKSYHVGDVIAKELGQPRLRVIEVKSGEVNERLMKVSEDSGATGLSDAVKDSGSSHLAEQARRMSRQRQRLESVQGVLNTGTGFDPATKGNIGIPDDVLEVEEWNAEFLHGLEESDSHDRYFACVDDCLHVMFAKAEGCDLRVVVDEFQDAIVERRRLEDSEHELVRALADEASTSLTDWREGMMLPCATPICCHGLPSHYQLDLMFGRKVVLVHLDLAAFVERAAQRGLHLVLCGRKESADLKSSELVRIGGRVLKADVGSMTVLIGTAIIGRMFFDLLRPESAITLLSHVPAEEEMTKVFKKPGPGEQG